MTTVVYPSLDGLLAAATPVEAEPFDLVEAMGNIRFGEYDETVQAGRAIARYVDALRCTIGDRERVAINLEADAARTDARIAEAVGLLEDAVVWTSAAEVNARDYILEALSALRDAE